MIVLAARALLRRALQAVFVALFVGLVCFLLVRSLPGDMAFRIAAGRYGYDIVGNQAAEAVRTELGLDRPAWRQVADWLGGLAQGDLGRSLVSGEPVAEEIAQHLGHTLLLAVVALGLAALLGPALGLAAGLRPGGLMDRGGLMLAAALRAAPAFLLGIGLLIVFSARLGWLPAADDGSAAALVLPGVTLALGLAAASSRVARDATVAAVGAPFFAFARLKGLSGAQAVLRHVLRNAAVPVVAYLGVQLVLLVEGVVAVEILFAWPGIGHALVHGVLARDIPLVQGAALAMGLAFVALNAVTDLLVLGLDPRRRTA